MEENVKCIIRGFSQYTSSYQVFFFFCFFGAENTLHALLYTSYNIYILYTTRVPIYYIGSILYCYNRCINIS